ncbi:MAG TPA: hypothetical protein VMG81_00855 [Thermoplasmata archaeon]|nr:hypothetical protein [Thermoplasmata archaeon]
MAFFQWPAGWVPFTVEPERLAAFKLTAGGNLEVAIDLGREIAGARLESPTRGMASSEELAEAIAGPTMTYQEAARYPPRQPGAYQLPLRTEGRPVVKPTTVMTERGPLPVNPREFSDEYFRRVYGMSRDEAVEAVRAASPQPPPRREPRAVERHEFAVALIPGAAVQAYREYLHRLPTARRLLRWYVWGAAWAIYLSEISAPTFGYFVQAAARGGLVYTVPGFPPAETLPRTVLRAARPSQVPDTVLTDTRGGRFVPVYFFSVAALLKYVMQQPLRAPDFDHLMRENGWQVCGRVPRAGNGIWCPSRAPTRREREEVLNPGRQVPLPPIEETGEAPTFQPRQRVLD